MNILGLISQLIGIKTLRLTDAIIKEGTADAWRLIKVYGAPETQKREETWALL